MFAALQASPAVSLDALVAVAHAFTPRFQVVGPFVLLDVGGLSSLFGSEAELGAALAAARPDCRSMALASTASTAMLLASGREGLTVMTSEAERAALAELPIAVLVAVSDARTSSAPSSVRASLRTPARLSAGLSPQAMALTLRRWGIRTLGALAALPRPEVHARLGELGVWWQHLAVGEDDGPMVPWVAEPVFEATMALEWPVEGFEPLSFVLARLLEPLAAALERADRGAVAIRTALRLTTREVHLRVLPLPAPMRDPKTLRTLVLLDLESHPPAAAVDQVQVRLEPTPGRVLQWTLFERARPAPEQVATLLARLTALVGEGRVGAPALVDAWRPGVFGMEPFGVPGAGCRVPGASAEGGVRGASAELVRSAESVQGAECAGPALRRFRLPVPVRVRVEEGRPVRLTTDRHGCTGGAIVQAAGPWRTSGEWWEGEERCREREQHRREWEARRRETEMRREWKGAPWDRDEWDIAMADGTVYRLFVERSVGQWFLEGVVD